MRRQAVLVAPPTGRIRSLLRSCRPDAQRGGFEPKSTRTLTPGDYWPLPIKAGRFACGRVLQTQGDHLPMPTRNFLGGLHAWVGDKPPTAGDLAGIRFAAYGIMHLRAIVRVGGRVLGNRPLEADDIELPLMLDAHGGPATRVVRGAQTVRPARRDEWGSLPILGFWGYDFIQSLADKLALEGTV
jgi:hypothetical protein